MEAVSSVNGTSCLKGVSVRCLLRKMLAKVICVALIGIAQAGPFRNHNTDSSWGYAFSAPLNPNANEQTAKPVSSVAFENRNGEFRQWNFNPDKTGGFVVTEYRENPGNSNRNILLKSANEIGRVNAAGIENGQAKYIVDRSLYESAGGISQLAYNLGAQPAGGVHNIRGRPNRNQRQEITPVLVHSDNSEDLFVLVPVQK